MAGGNSATFWELGERITERADGGIGLWEGPLLWLFMRDTFVDRVVDPSHPSFAPAGH